jgi:protease-4
VKKRTAWVLVAAVAAVSLGAAAVGAVALLMRSQGPAAGSGRTYLHVDLDHGMPEQSPSELGELFDSKTPAMRQLVSSIDRAARDEGVNALVLNVTFLDAGWGRVQELRDAVERFKKSGKPAYAHLEIAGNKEYYLASACTKVYAVPTALLDVTGLRSEVTFFRGTLDKLGVQAQFTGVGRYKNAPNQFTETGFTEPHREQMEALVESLYGRYLESVAQARGKTVAEMQALFDGGPYDGWSAKEAGLVDELIYTDQLDERLQHAGRVAPRGYLRAKSGFGFGGREKLALVYAVGEIMNGRSQDGLGGSTAGSETVAAALRKAREDDTIKAIILRVDSPGGSGSASDVIWREVALARQKKPVIASFGDYAASGGYYVAMGADAIVAEPGTITGSIGVFSGKFNLRGLYEKVGISKEIVARGQNATFTSEYQPWSPSELARMQAMNEAFYRDFVRKVAEGRRKTVDEIEAVAQGRVWTGTEAQRHGLVDQLGGLDVAVAVAREKAGIPKGQEVGLVVLPEPKGFLETILERQQGMESMALLPTEAKALLRVAQSLGASGQPLARLPFVLAIR